MSTHSTTPSLALSGKHAKRRTVLLCILGIFTIYLVSVLFRLQILEYSIFEEKVLRQITVGSSLAAERGNIYDRNGNLLATNRTVWRIYLSPVDIKKASKRDGKAYAEQIAKDLSSLLSLSYDSLYSKAKESSQLDKTVLRGADEETARAVLTYAKENGFSSMIHAEAGTERYYPFSTLASHTIGFTGSDNKGLFGLEAYYDEILRGTDGRYLATVDSQGVRLPNAYSDYIEAEDGLSLVTTLDLFMQRELEHQLEQALIGADAQNRATGIVMNVKTGDILAMATAPSFDLNDPYTLDEASQSRLASSGLVEGESAYKQKKSELLYAMWSNKAVSEIYEPGSTFKIITVSAALEEKAVTEHTVFSCPGYYTVGGCRIRCHKHGGHGTLTLAEGLMQSCNPVMMQSAERLGKDAFYKYFQAFGYGKKTGIDLPGEATGLFHSYASLGSTELATASFGQRFKVSVIGQLSAVAAVANKGIPVTPHLLRAFQNEKGEQIFTYTPVERERVLSEETARSVAAILEEGVSGNGGAKNAYVEGYGVAAKTGTSEKFEILDANGNSFLRIGSCVAFAPYDDAEIAVILIVDEPTSQNKYGSAIAAPFISAYLNAVLPYLGVKRAVPSQAVELPSVVGMSPAEASKTLRAIGIEATVFGEGDRVISQVPTAGTPVLPSLSVCLLYTEGGRKEVSVPKLIGKTLKDAVYIARNAGLTVKILGASLNARAPNEAVVSTQSIPPDSRVPMGTELEIRIVFPSDSD